MQWYGARTIYQYERAMPLARAAGTFVYEERVITLQADDSDDAIQITDHEAGTYAERQECHHTGHVDTFHMCNPPGDLAEVYSFMRKTELTAQEYVAHFAHPAQERPSALRALRRVQWYCAKSLINFENDAKYHGETLVEERLVLVQLGSPLAARAEAENEARRQADAEGGESLGVTALYRVPAEHPGHLVEVFSQLRVSELDGEEYLRSFVVTGRENF